MKKEVGDKKYFSNRALYTFILLGIFILLLVGIYALNPATDAWHSSSSISFSDNSILSNYLANNAVTSAKIADGTITGSDVNNGASFTIGALTVNGDVTANSFIYSSDKALKENIVPLTNSLDKINQLQGVSFNWKQDKRQSIGLIAQDVEKVIPEIVHTSKDDGLKSIEYGNLVALLIEGMKEQQKQIDSLQKQIDELKALN